MKGQQGQRTEPPCSSAGSFGGAVGVGDGWLAGGVGGEQSLAAVPQSQQPARAHVPGAQRDLIVEGAFLASSGVTPAQA